MSCCGLVASWSAFHDDDPSLKLGRHGPCANTIGQSPCSAKCHVNLIYDSGQHANAVIVLSCNIT